MNWETYRERALQTAPSYETPDEQLLHGASKLPEEAQELQNAVDLHWDVLDEFTKEAGDCYWYIAIIDDVIRGGYDIVSDMPGGITRKVAWLSGAIGSHVYQDAPIDDILSALGHVRGTLQRWIQDCPDITRDDVWTQNLNKLRDRHGNSFTPYEDQNR